MRNLTITRRKSIVACAGKDHVYIRDEQSSEITIEGVPCRKIGVIKNGEEKTFLIEEDEQQIFLIADKLSKEICNASLVIPAGQEDVSLSGKHHFALGSNPFRFDGVQLSAEQIAKQKKNNRRGANIFIAAAIAGFALGFALLPRIFLADPDPKVFTKENFEITLTDAFEETKDSEFFSCYTSKAVMVFVVREDKALFGDITLDEYSELVQQNNNRTNLEPHKEDGFIWFEYTYAAEGQEAYYLAACYEGESHFWVVNFATPAANQDNLADTFLQWAKTLKAS